MKAKCFTRIGKSQNDDCEFTDSGLNHRTTLMFKKFIPLAFVLASATSAFAGSISEPTTTTTTSSIKNDPSLFLGLSWTLGGQDVGGGTPGVTLKILSTNERDAPAAAAGVTYNLAQFALAMHPLP